MTDHCNTCENFRIQTTTKYLCRRNCCYIHPNDTCPCKPSQYKEATQKRPFLRIIDTLNGKQYAAPKDLQQLCIDAGLSDRLTYCDIECLITDGESWYMLDECGNWAYLPSGYRVEEVR